MKLKVILLIFTSFFAACDDGDVKSDMGLIGHVSIMVDNASQIVVAEGGECTIRVNHDDWYFEHAEICVGKKTSEYDWTHVVNLETDWFTLERLEGDGLRIPEREFYCDGILRCMLKPNDTGEERRIMLTLRCEVNEQVHEYVDVTITQKAR